MFKKIFALVLVVVMAMSLFTGCKAGKYEDGVYFAQEEEFSENGWKYYVTVTVENGKITDAHWTGVQQGGGKDKYTMSKDGEYGMTKSSDTAWYEQADKVVEYLIDKQEAVVELNEDGKTDAISGATVTVKPFFDLVTTAFENGPVPEGEYKDGHYTAQEEEFSHGYKYIVDLDVANGTIVRAYWTAISEEEDGKDKRTASKDGEYGMEEEASAAWYKQAQKVENYLLDSQDPADIELNDEGGTDAISGATITVEPFFNLAQEALENAK